MTEYKNDAIDPGTGGLTGLLVSCFTLAKLHEKGLFSEVEVYAVLKRAVDGIGGSQQPEARAIVKGVFPKATV